MSTYANTRPELSAGIKTLPAKYYTDPTFAKAGIGAVGWHRHWDR